MAKDYHLRKGLALVDPIRSEMRQNCTEPEVKIIRLFDPIRLPRVDDLPFAITRKRPAGVAMPGSTENVLLVVRGRASRFRSMSSAGIQSSAICKGSK